MTKDQAELLRDINDAIHRRTMLRGILYASLGFTVGNTASYWLLRLNDQPKPWNFWIWIACLVVLPFVVVWSIFNQKRLRHLRAARTNLVGLINSEIGSNKWFHHSEQLKAAGVAIGSGTRNENKTDENPGG